MSKRKYVMTVLVTLIFLLAACAPQAAPAPVQEQPTQPPAAPTNTTVAIQASEATSTPVVMEEGSMYSEAPALADQVAAGQLPPVEERLPVTDDISIVATVEQVGKYGGTWNAVTNDPGAGNIKMILYDPPVRWKPDDTGYEPGLAKSYEWTDDGKTITFKFREGIKWSDGEPFNTDDLKFWWEDMAQNEDYKKVTVPWWAHNADQSVIEMEFPDQYTWVLHFKEAQYIMPYVLAQGFWEWEPLMKPAHFLKQFHPTYTSTATYEDLDLKDRFTETPGYPCLMAWCLADYVPGQTWTFDRNPYYWKVDTAGNQLPYIDTLRVELVQDQETRKLRVAQGSYDCTFRGTDDPQDIPFLLEQGQQYDYRVVPGWMNGAGAWPGFMINMDYHAELEYDAATEPPEAKETRELIRTHEFREGLAYALDRQKIVDVVWDGIGEVKGFTISPQSWHFATPEGQDIYKEWAASYAEYDPEKAKEMFDAVGFVDANGDGYRELPSGAPYTLIMDLNDWGGERVNTEADEIYRQNLEDVGVKVVVNNVIGQAEGGTRGENGVGWTIRNAHASEIDLWTYPDWIFPVRGAGEGTRAFPMQGTYYKTGGTAGWQPEPGSPAERLQAIYRQGLSEPDIAKRHELIYQAVKIYIEDGPFLIAGGGDQPMPVVCKNNFRNVPEYGVLGPWAPGSPGNVHPEQFYFE